jgi:hypothetical protein
LLHPLKFNEFLFSLNNLTKAITKLPPRTVSSSCEIFCDENYSKVRLYEIKIVDLPHAEDAKPPDFAKKGPNSAYVRIF